MSGTVDDQQRGESVLALVSRELVSLHKEQFGRGPTRGRAHFAGDNTLVCTLEDALLPAERTMVEIGDHQRVREARAAMQAATSRKFIGVVEQAISRKVVAFASAIDPGAGVVWEVFQLEDRGAPARETSRDGTGH
jgi:uncharacterized protein YbcI